MFTRKLILPAYANGLHTYLNSCAVIYNGEYKRVLDYSCAIEDISTHSTNEDKNFSWRNLSIFTTSSGIKTEKVDVRDIYHFASKKELVGNIIS